MEYEDRTFTFGEIDARSNRLAQVLMRRGLKNGDRLCVYLVNCVEMIDIYLACIKLGVIFVPINILYRDREISHILSRRGAARVDVSDTTDCGGYRDLDTRGPCSGSGRDGS